MTESSRLEAVLDALHGSALEAFIDERKRLAKELRGAGDRPAAVEVAKLRKPSAAAWALNHISREAPDVLDEWLSAGERLRDASSRPAEVGGEGVRAAIAAHRAATAKLMEVLRERARPGGRPLSEDMLDRARKLLQSATADAALADRLRHGRVTEEQPPDHPVAARAAPAPQPPEPVPRPADRRGAAPAESAAARRRREGEARRREAAAQRHAERTAELDRRIRAAEAEIERLAAKHGDRIAAAGKADKRVEAARRALREAEARAKAARVAVREHEEALRAAEAGLQELRGERRAGPPDSQ